MNENYLKQLGDQIALTHWAQSNEKTYEEICDRVVNYICDDQSEEGRNYNRRMKDLLKSKKFIPNSPCWINSGTDMKNLFACYVIDLKDNMSSIMDTAKRMAMIMKEGGGVGVSLTPIRAEGARVGGEGSNRTASGPISFLKVFDAVVGAVKSAGVRRGAALANLKTGHPDLIKFIKCKEDQNQINNFNLSVAITDEFMDDVINDSDKIWAEEDGVKYTAAAIYKMIVHHMWQNGEPGVQFIDTVNDVDGKYTGRPEFREFNTGIEVSNPCVTGETLVLTRDKGPVPIEDLVEKEVEVWNGKKWSKVTPYYTGKSHIHTVVVAADPVKGSGVPGQSHRAIGMINCTPYHNFILDDGTRIEARYLTDGTKLMPPNAEHCNCEIGSYNRHENYIIYGEVAKQTDGPKQKTYCLTEPEEHAFTVIARNNYLGEEASLPVLIGNCGESFLKPNEACNLASINLYHFVNPFWKGKDENKDMALRQELKQTVEDAIEFLNKMMDKSETPFPEINEAVKQSRKVGLGVMGLADYLSAKGIVYGSPEAIHEAADVFAFITKTAEEYSLRKGHKNALLTIQAPTGTTGLVGEVSTGIEPHFLRCWTRHSIKMGDLLMYPKSLRDYIYARCGSTESDSAESDSPELKAWSSICQAMESNDMKRFSDLIECGQEELGIKKFWPTAHEVTPRQHLAMLAAIQRHVHNSVSKTINLPHDATEEDVRDLITTAWRSKCKGFTCYRDGSRDSQPLKAVDNKDKSNTTSDKLNTNLAYTFAKDINVPCKRPRPNVTYGETVKTKIGCGSIYITVNKDENGTCEVFTNLGRTGGCPSQSEATSRLISLALRSGVKVEDVIDQLKGIRCMNTMRKGGIKQPDGTVVLSCPDAIGKAIEKISNDWEGRALAKLLKPEESDNVQSPVIGNIETEVDTDGNRNIKVYTALLGGNMICPDCGKELERDGGCVICRHCGYSKCG